jgi:H+/Cl- antiporter ClcA
MTDTIADSAQPTHSSSFASWRAVVITSVAAILTGFAAYYFVLAEGWGDTLVKCLQGDHPIFGLQVTGAWTWILPAIFIAISMMLIVVVQRKFFPGTEGTGIPQAIAALKIGDRPERALMLSVRIAIGKTLLLTVALLSGITVGREGPSVHVGACFMHLCTKVTRLPPFLVQRGLILAGSAAGIAAAFNTPIAGVVFCFEEVGRMFDRKSVACIIRTVALACGVVVVFKGDYMFYTSANHGAQLPLGFPEQGGFPQFLQDLRQWIAVPLAGIIGGFLGGWFGKGVVVTSKFTGPRLVKHPWITGAALGIALALIAIASFGESYGGGYDQAKAMLVSASPEGSGVPTVSWYYPIAKASASFVSLVSGIPGGLFDPSLAVGASLGQVTYPLFNNDFIAPGIGLPEMMMLFMAAYFAGVVQSPITVFVIMFEMTGAYGMILPLMFASMIGAMMANRICEPSIYEALAYQFLDAKGIRKLAPEETDE